jgi:hypothetical protein
VFNIYDDFITGLFGDSKLESENRQTISMVNFCYWLICFSLTLFLFAIDWGRWISMHVTLCILMLLLALPDKPTRNQTPQASVGSTKNAIGLLFAAGCFVFFSLSYSLGHCCARDFFRPFGPLNKIQHTAIFERLFKTSQP